MHEIVTAFAGMLLCNCIPHLAAGLRGEPFPTPFAKPRGVGLSSPILNFFWGSANLAFGAFLARRSLALGEPVPALIAIAIGFLIMGSYLSRHFGKVREQREKTGEAAR